MDFIAFIAKFETQNFNGLICLLKFSAVLESADRLLAAPAITECGSLRTTRNS